MSANRNHRSESDVPVTRLGAGVGQAPPVAMLHGLLESNALWRTPGVAGIVSRYPAIALPLPGHHPWHLSAPALAGLLHGDGLAHAYADALRHAFDGRPVRLIGHSAGALVALEIARLHPELVAGVCIVGALRNGRLLGRRSLMRDAACLSVGGGWPFRMMLRAWLATPCTFRAGLRSVMGPGGPAGAMPLSVLHDLRRSDPRGLHTMALWLHGWRGLVEADHVDVPAFSVICASDPVVHPSQQLALARALPRTRSVVLPGGHLPMVEHPTAFGDALQGWLGAPPPVRFAALSRPVALCRNAAASLRT